MWTPYPGVYLNSIQNHKVSITNFKKSKFLSSLDLPRMKGGEKDMKKLACIFVFVSLMAAAIFWATAEVDYLTCTACINPYLIGT